MSKAAIDLAILLDPILFLLPLQLEFLLHLHIDFVVVFEPFVTLPLIFSKFLVHLLCFRALGKLVD
jgi:hypothetical protein